jgi:hypothetical protein
MIDNDGYAIGFFVGTPKKFIVRKLSHCLFGCGFILIKYGYYGLEIMGSIHFLAGEIGIKFEQKIKGNNSVFKLINNYL